MEAGKLRQALDQILRRCKAAGHRLHVFDPSDISHEEVVGRGEEGIVQLCRVNFHGLQEYAAIKTITTNGGKEMLDFLLQELELVVMGSDSLANAVLKVFGVVLVPVNLKTRSHHSAMCHLGIVMERGLCNLFQLLAREELDLYLRLDLMRQLARALHHLHTGDPHIIHRDVKPQNVVVTEAERSERTGLLKNVRVKLIDLGMACAVRHLEEKVSSVVGTEGYHAPEMWEEQPYTHKADIFSLGVTFLMVLLKRDALTKVTPLMESLHEAKVEGRLGQKLFSVAEDRLMEDVSELPELQKLLYAMLAGAGTRLSDAGYIYNELTRILTDVTPSSRLAIAHTPVISFKSSGRLARRSSIATKHAGNGGATSATTSTSGESKDSKDSDYSSLDSGAGGSKRSSTPVTPRSSVARDDDDENDETNWRLPKFRNFYTQTPNSEKFKRIEEEEEENVIVENGKDSSSSSIKSRISGGKRASRSTSVTKIATLSSSSTRASSDDRQIEVLEERLRKKDDALSFKDKLIVDKDKKLVEQRKTMQKLEIQNREFRQQLALSKAKDGDSSILQGRFNPITKQIRPRSLFPNDMEVKSEPMAMTSTAAALATRLAEVAADATETGSLDGKNIRSCKDEKPTALPEVNGVYKVSPPPGDRVALSEADVTVKIERESSVDRSVENVASSISAAISTLATTAATATAASSNSGASNRIRPRSSRKRKIQVESPTPCVEKSAPPPQLPEKSAPQLSQLQQPQPASRKSGRVIAAKASRRRKNESTTAVVEDGTEQSALKISDGVSDAEVMESLTSAVDPMLAEETQSLDLNATFTIVKGLIDEPMDVEKSPDVDVAMMAAVLTPEVAPPPPKRRKKTNRRGSSMAAKEDVLSTASTAGPATKTPALTLVPTTPVTTPVTMPVKTSVASPDTTTTMTRAPETSDSKTKRRSRSSAAFGKAIRTKSRPDSSSASSSKTQTPPNSISAEHLKPSGSNLTAPEISVSAIEGESAAGQESLEKAEVVASSTSVERAPIVEGTSRPKKEKDADNDDNHTCKTVSVSVAPSLAASSKETFREDAPRSGLKRSTSRRTCRRRSTRESKMEIEEEQSKNVAGVAAMSIDNHETNHSMGSTSKAICDDATERNSTSRESTDANSFPLPKPDANEFKDATNDRVVDGNDTDSHEERKTQREAANDIPSLAEPPSIQEPRAPSPKLTTTPRDFRDIVLHGSAAKRRARHPVRSTPNQNTVTAQISPAPASFSPSSLLPNPGINDPLLPTPANNGTHTNLPTLSDCDNSAINNLNVSSSSRSPRGFLDPLLTLAAVASDNYLAETTKLTTTTPSLDDHETNRHVDANVDEAVAVSGENVPRPSLPEEKKDFTKIFGPKTYTGRKVNKSPFVSPIRSPPPPEENAADMRNIFKGKLLILSPPSSSSPFDAPIKETSSISNDILSTAPPIDSRPISIVSPPPIDSRPIRIVSPPPSDHASNVAYPFLTFPSSSDAPSAVSSLTSSLPGQPSLRRKWDVPNLSWILGERPASMEVDGVVGASSAQSNAHHSGSSKSPSRTAGVKASASAPTLLSPQSPSSRNHQPSPPKYHFVPTTRSVTLSPQHRPSVIMSNRVAIDNNGHTSIITLASGEVGSNGYSGHGVSSPSSGSRVVPPAATSTSGLTETNGVTLTPMRFVPLPSAVVSPLLPSFQERLGSGTFSLSSSSSSHFPSPLNGPSVSLSTGTSSSSSSRWINGDFFSLPLGATNEVNLERELRPSSLASPRPSLRNGQN